ncbi:putative mediator of RNA polymerase II transcription subunit 26 isoform X2 [Folsomia candida]|uniref:putative mediator of RNA polymerase II transcription subunit 26 isoform X2 n=1 Tax=Folsomia candida TaxID=158441 RepID=UPI000B907A3D|nr:putative mediator of RNA polymerase II transcription subunit 26 isoform X2 [Folsomia candida]
MSSVDVQNQGQASGGSNNDQGQGGGEQVAQQQQQQQQQQQLQLQQNNAAQNVQGNQQQQQMQQLQVIQQPLQNQAYLQHVYNAQGQPQLIMQPSNIAFNQLNPQIQPAQLAPSIQVITGKPFQPNQLSSPHMLTTATGYATIPTSAANSAYIIGNLGQLINSSQQNILQHQQTNKPGEMQKVIQPQITQAQLQQGITWAPQLFQNLQNPIFIRGTQPDQQPMFIQQQQPLHNNSGSHQQFTMPLTATGHTTTSNGLQISQQQQQQNPQTSQSAQSVMSVQQNQTQSGNGSVTLTPMKAPGQANLQPKPQPLQIQPSPTNQTNQQQQQATHHQQLQNVNVSMGVGGPQFQMIPQNSQANVQQILTQNAQGQLTTQVIQQQQQGGQGQPQQQRHLTILPQQGGGHQQLTFIQQQPQPQQQQQQQQQQQIRPNYTVTAASPIIQQGGTPTTATAPQQRPKIRKPGVGRGTVNQNQGQNAQSPNQKAMYPRPTMPNAVGQGGQIQVKSVGPNQQGHGSQTGATISRIAVANAGQQQQQQQPLKTINLSALHTPPTLPDATLTPLIPQSNQQITATLIPPPTQQLQLFTTTHLPTPNISITPAPLPTKKDESGGGAEMGGEHRGETEKENTKMKQSTQSSEDDSKQKLPKAMVKPQAQILTHVIEGFVIQEAGEPFPPVHKNGECDEPPKKKLALAHLGQAGGEFGKCEMCGKLDLKSKFKKNKRFCSSACAKGSKAQSQQQNNVPQVNNSNNSKAARNNKKWVESGDGELTDETSSSMGDTTCSSPAIHDEPDPKMNPVKWNVAEVVDFVRSLPGCSEYADDFAVQEIDGQALMLLKEDHLMSAIGMKLGPALKLCAKIEALRIANSGGDQSSCKA